MINDAYLESKILSSDPVGLIRLLYDAAIRAVRNARAHLASGEIAERARAISKAIAILTELSGSLNHAVGGEISRNLARLYEYMQERLLEANLQQTDQPLAEVLGLLNTLAEAWHGESDARPETGAQIRGSAPVWTNRSQMGDESQGARAWSA